MTAQRRIDARTIDNTGTIDQAAAPATILVVDDEPLVRLAIVDMLLDCGYRVFEAANGDEAIHLLDAGEARIDIVFSDIQMPGRHDGFAVSRWVHANRPGVRVLLTSGNAHALDQARQLRNGGLLDGDAVVAKPYDHAALLRRIGLMREGHSSAG